jgi:predicted MPP superfamily phosphohydrolase
LVGCASSAGNKVAAEGSGDVSNAAAERFPLGASRLSECGDGALTNEGAVALDRLPYLQRVSATSADVLFTVADTAAPPSVRVTLPDGRAIENVRPELDPSDASGRQHVARIEGLEAGQIYCHSIDGWTHPAGFRTAPAPGSAAPVRFVVFGDSGGGPQQSAVREQIETVAFDLLLHVGDIAYGQGTLGQLESQFFDEYADILRHVPAFPTSGNHDYTTDRGAPFRQVFALPDNGTGTGSERWYSFDWGLVHFVALDTERIDATQTEWLDRDLGANQLPWTVVYLHRPPYSSGDHGSSTAVREAFVPLFERYGVDIVFAGHDHDYERTEPLQGVTYIVTGGGGRSTRAVGRSSFTAYSEDVLHFVYAEVDDDTMMLHAIDAVGREFDSLRLERPRTGS